MDLKKWILGNHSAHELKKINPIVDKVMDLEGVYKTLSDKELQAKTKEFRSRLSNDETLDDILVEAFATASEAAWRVLGLRPYRVQLVAGVVLHQGRIAEMKTGEGKTLMAVAPAYLNALAGQGVHVVTVNEYLAKRDSDWMGKVYRFLGLSVGLVGHDMTHQARQAAYLADITYSTNNELGFDYLRDNMCVHAQDRVQRGHRFAIVDEVDSILIDEARTPLIIAGKGGAISQLYSLAEQLVSGMKCLTVTAVDNQETEKEDIDADYVADETERTATLTARGIQKAEAFFGLENLSDLKNTSIYHHINQALRAHGTMHRDVQYVIKDGEVMIVDEYTGRMMFGRRFNDGLHQAIEAKEHVNIVDENKTLATITFQNYFRLYPKLSGMTGTATTEEEEFSAIYDLDIVEIPTNRPNQRVDLPDVVHKDQTGKHRAIIAQIRACHEKGQPVLVGTVSVEKNEQLSKLLKKEGIIHQVLNAKNHELEAEIIAQAGRLGAVTIATNMAGRGTDIMLGGNADYLASDDLRKSGMDDDLIAQATGFAETEDAEILQARQRYAQRLTLHKEEIAQEAEKVREVGGLCIIGTERHDSRRIDNQLRGRAGRQGDPGTTQFFLALDDELLRLYGGPYVEHFTETCTVAQGEAIESKKLMHAIENAQMTQESRHFQSRKSVIEYDDVVNQQRNLIYDQRCQVLEGKDLKATILSMVKSSLAEKIATAYEQAMTEETYHILLKNLEGIYIPTGQFPWVEGVSQGDLTAQFTQAALANYEAKEAELTPKVMREAERMVLLHMVDTYWMEHIDAMEELKKGIRFHAYGGTNPIDAYKQEGVEMFHELVSTIQSETVRQLYGLQGQTIAIDGTM